MRPVNLKAAMRGMLLLLALASVVQVNAAEAVRCGTDAFGNAVCLDKDGVAAPAPRALRERIERDVSGDANDGGDKAAHGKEKRRVRCGLDQFGNKVCR